MQIIIGFSLGVLISYLAKRAGALTTNGAWAATLTGGLIFSLGGAQWASLILAFFLSSSILSRAFSQHKRKVAEKFAKGAQRDWGQVLANGGLGAGLVLIQAFNQDQIWPWIAYAGAMAAVNADTWATELGVFSPSPPRLIVNGKPVERGASGGISLTGYLAVLAGAALISAIALPFTLADGILPAVLAIVLGGFTGSTVDSFLGATIQTIYYCPGCQKETERHPRHSCGTETAMLRGWHWLNNDWVNFFASLSGALAATLTWSLLAA